MKELIKKYDLKAKKSLGQNFLIDGNILNKIIESADIKKSDHIIEVGPGLGILTKELTKKAKKVTAIELDSNLVKILEKELAHNKNLKIINQDALKFSPPKSPYKVVANIPYYITSPLLNHFLQTKIRPSKMIILMQKEVAEKICAKEGNLNVLAIHVQIFGKPRIIQKVSKNCFYPTPKVDSAILEINVYNKPIVEQDIGHFLDIVHAGFKHKRKTITNSLSKTFINTKEALKQSNISLQIRAEKLSFKDWVSLSKNLQ